ncbi:MAG: response regulator [Acidimicrobiia bacterium]|nr:response regulator [Acidimicrobiia bacterium]
MPGGIVSMRLKAFIAIAIVVVVGTGALCAVLWRLSTDSFGNVEADLVTRDAERAHGIVQTDIAALSSTAVDWAEWDDTYDFVEASTAAGSDADAADSETSASDYVDSNLNASTYKQNGIDTFAVYSTNGTSLYQGAYDRETGTVAAGIDPALSAFAADRALHTANGATGAFRGVLAGSGQGGPPYEVVAVPVLRSDATGPPNGVLVMARALDAAALSRFGETLRLPLSLVSLADVDLESPDLADLAAEPPRFAATVGDDVSSQGYATLETLGGAPPLVLTFSEAPTVAALNDSQQARLAALLVLMGAVMALVMIVIADKYVLTRLLTMSRTVDHIAVSGDVSERIPDLGRDEIGRLASGTNAMLTRIETATTALEAARADAEAGSRAKSEFLANMSHELRTPLHAILGMTRLAFETDTRSERNEMLSTVEASATTLLDMVDDVLVLSQEEAGTLELNLVPFSPAALAGELAAAATAKVQPSVEVRAVVPEDVAGAVIGDEGRIRHCLGNLVSNAVKFTAHGSIEIAVSQTGAHADPGADVMLRFVVTDTGAGIPPERLADVLDAFEQVDTSSTRRYGGTGLGVTVAARLARRMGGDLKLDSEPATGTAVTVTVPATVPPRSVAAAVQPPASEFATGVPGPMSVLVVEDNQVNQRVARRMLERWGHQVSVVENGAQAVAAVAEDDVDVVLMDIQMPVMDGLEAARRIRAAEAGSTRHLPIVALTAHAMAGDRERCLDAGMDAYVTKPFNAETLGAALATVTGANGAAPGRSGLLDA